MLERCASDLHLYRCIASVEIRTHLLRQRRNVLPRIIVASRCVNRDCSLGCSIAVSLRKHLKQWLAFNLPDDVPERHVDAADCDGTVTVSSWLLIRHHDAPSLLGIYVVAAFVQYSRRGCLHQARDD